MVSKGVKRNVLQSTKKTMLADQQYSCFIQKLIQLHASSASDVPRANFAKLFFVPRENTVHAEQLLPTIAHISSKS